MKRSSFALALVAVMFALSSIAASSAESVSLTNVVSGATVDIYKDPG